MRVLVLIVGLALACSALADDKRKHKPVTVTKPVDKATPLMSSGNPGNPSDSATAADAKEKANRTKTRAQDYNSSRSNTTSLRGGPRDRASGLPTGKRQHAADGGGLGKETRCSMGRLDCDDDGDSIPVDDACRNGVDDDCDGVVDEAPANHNTTRSNRTQPAHGDNDRVVRKKPGRTSD